MKKIIISLFTAVVLAFAPAAVGQSLQTYFNFTTYGTQSGGAALADLTGHTTATLNTEAHTTLTVSGLTISSGGSSLSTGATIGSAAMSGFTGAFSIQQWTTLAAVNNNQVLFGANNGDVNTYVGDGSTVSTLIGAIRGGAISAYVGGSTPSYLQGGYGVADSSGTASTATLYDVVLTYDGTSFREYVNGTLKGTLNMPTFGSLAQACSADSYTGKSGFAIGGGMNDPFTDTTLPEITSDFLLYNGALSQAQIIQIHNLGAGASLSAITNVFAPPTNSEAWSGGGSDNTWTNVANWTKGHQPNVGDPVLFAGTTQTTANMNTNFSVGSLTFYSSAGNFSITNAAYTLTLTGGVTNDSANGQTINVPVSLGANLAINALVGNLTFGQNIANIGNTVTFAGGYNVTVNGAITGSAGLTQSGTGTLTLLGANNLTGTTMVSNGTVIVGGAPNQSLGSTIMVKDGATLGVTASVTTNYLSPSSLVVGGSSGATLQFGLAGTNNAPLRPTTLTLNGTTTINISGCQALNNNYPLFTGYTSGTLVLGSQPPTLAGKLTVNGSTVYYTVTNWPAFAHPSALHTQADFDRMKAKVAAGAHPWIDSYNILINNSSAQANYTPTPMPTLQRGSGGGACLPSDNYWYAYWDTAAAYQLALRWKITGDNNYANAAINILNQWANTCTNLCGDPNIALLSIYGYQFACAGDIMRSYSGWAPADVTKFQVWMVNLWYPLAHQFLYWHDGTCSTYIWANWDLCALDSMMAIGILSDDVNIYNEALNYFKTGVGNGNIEQTVYTVFPGYLGQGQEEGRDQGHSGLEVSLLGVFCSMAYHQGDDMFGYENNRVLSLCEYFAKYNLGNDVPFLFFDDCNNDQQWGVSSASQGDTRPCWDLIYNHYVNLKGIAAPWSQQYAALMRPEGGGGNYGGNSGGYDQLGFTTLTCSLDPILIGANPSGLTAILNGSQQVQLNWWGAANATNYLVKRATTRGGPYTTIATITTNLLTDTDSNVTNGVTYYYTVSALTPLGESGNGNEAVVSLQPQLIAYYKFNESSGTSAADASGNGQTATLNGAAWTTGHSNNAVSLSGSSQYVTLPNNITTNLTGDFTIATWVYLNATTMWPRIFDFGVGNVPTSGAPSTPVRYMFLTPWGASGGVRFSITTGGNGAEQQVNGASALPASGWHHVAVTLAGTTCSIYVDGALSGSGTITLTPAQLGSTTQNWIGRSQFSNWPNNDPYLDALVDDFRIYSGALSAAQVAALAVSYPVQPSAPTNVVATVVSANQINLTWSPALRTTNYYVKRSLVSGGSYTTVSVPLTVTNFSDTGLVCGTTYYYVIASANDGGTTNSAQVSATTLTAPPAPASLTAVAELSGAINLSWPASAGATSYNVLRAIFGGGPYVVVATGVTSTGYTNTGLYSYSPVTYYYVVSASNANGAGTNSVEASATTQPLPGVPTGVVAVAGYTSAQLTWNAATYAAGYNVKRSPTSGSGYVTITNVTATTFLDTGLTNGVTDYYVVSATNAGGESANSTEVSATPTDLIDWWKFDEGSGSTAADAGVHGNNGTLMSGATWVPGIITNAVHLDGTANAYVSFPAGLASTLNDFSICCWVKADVSNMWARVFDFGSGTGTYMFLTPVGGSGTVRYAITTGSYGGEQAITNSSALSTGVWHHLGVTLSGTTGVLYIDGKAVGTNSGMTLKPSSLGSTTLNYIGKSQYPDTNLTGSVDDFRIYARALSGGEVATLSTFVPSVPVGLAAVAGNAKATLAWGASGGASSYNVKRSTTSGSGYVTMANVTTSHYVNSGLANGTTYYYVVSATNATGESANSAEASVTPNAGAATALFWSGAVNGTWDTTTANWLNSVTAATFADGNAAIFDDTGANTTVNLSANRSPGTVIVNNSAVNCTIGGSAIAGSGSLVKSGVATLTLSGANTYSGGTTLNAGQITLGGSSVGYGNSVTSGALGKGTVTLSGGTVQLNAKELGNNLLATAGTTSTLDNTGGDGNLDGNLSGGGTVTLQNSSGGGMSLKISQNASVDWSGFTGTLNYNSANGQVFNVFMPTSFNLANATLNTGGSGTPPGNWSSMRAGGTNLLGALSGTKGYLDFGGLLVIGGLNSNTTFGGAIIDAVGITKVGTGTLTLTGANTYTGNTTVSNGELIVSTVFAGAGNFVITNGATLGITNLSATSALVSNLTAAAGTALEFQNVSSTTTPFLLASNVALGGSCAVKITGTNSLVVSNSYPLIKFSRAFNGGFANLQLQMPYGWRGTLAQVGSQIVLTNVALVSMTQPLLNIGTGNGLMQINWPSDHTGWRLLMSTNLGSPDWTDVSSNFVTMTNQVILPVIGTNGSLFYRLVYP